MASHTVLILDDDLGFCMWLGRILNDAGISALPASRSEEAMEIGDNYSSPIDLLIVNPHIEGASDVLARYPSAKVIAIGGPGKLTVDATLRRPRGFGAPPAERYIKIVTDILDSGAATA